MRTLSEIPTELSNLELGLELELNSDDVAAAEAAVAAHGALFTCSCCNQELSDKESLHLHHISQHSISQLSIALLSLRGFNVSSELEAEGSQELCCGDSESESTVSAHSSFMCGFADEFNNTVNEVCALNGTDTSNTDIGAQSASLSNAPQYSSDCAGNYCFGGTATNLDMNSNLESKIGNDAADLIESIAQNSLLTNSNDISKVSCNPRQAAVAFLNELCETEDAASLPVLGNNPKRLLSEEDRQVTIGDKREEVTPKRQKLTREKSNSKGCEKQASTDCDRREFPCEICGRRYKRKSHLGRHIRMHSGVRPFACTVCDKRFAVRSILKQHMRVHTGERPFKCHFCSQGFPQKSGLVTHMMLHTGKPYKCDLCSKSFVSNHKLSVHKRSHEEQSGHWPMLGPHSCPTCATRFFTNSALLEHANVHIGAPSGATKPRTTPPLTPRPIAASVEPNERPRVESADAFSGTPNYVNINKNTHNSQEVTAGQALLTLMDSNVLKDEPGSGVGETSPKEDCAFSDERESENASDGVIDFEFCDVPLDLKPCIYLKEECFEIDSTLDKSPGNNRLTE